MYIMFFATASLVRIIIGLSPEMNYLFGKYHVQLDFLHNDQVQSFAIFRGNAMLEIEN